MSSTEEYIEKNSYQINDYFTEDQRIELAIRIGKPIQSIFEDVDVEYLLNAILNMSEIDARNILTEALKFHSNDPNFHQHTLDTIHELLDGSSDIFDNDLRLYNMKVEAALIYYDSPYPEVRAITNVRHGDDPTMSTETFRVYLVGAIVVTLHTGVNQLFETRLPPITISTMLMMILVSICGKLLSKLPDWGVTYKEVRYSINPHPWTYKEHVLVTVMLNVTKTLPTVANQILVQKLPVFFNNTWADIGYQITLTLSTQFLGFGIAGLVRHILVYPVSCLWPASFPFLALSKALLIKERRDVINGWKISRMKMFFYCFLIMFLYFWFPNYLFKALSIFNWITWIAPNNFNLAAITGSISGLGINPIPTFDWNIINRNGILYTPFFSVLQQYLGALIGGAIIIPAIYYSNLFNTGYLPINNINVFDNTGKPYSFRRILGEDGLLDKDLYENYSAPFLTAGAIFVLGVAVALFPALMVDTFLQRGDVFFDGLKVLVKTILGKTGTENQYDDVHSRMMRRYKEAPSWWYFIISIIAFIIGVICLTIYPTETPIWALFVAILLGVIFIVPIGFVAATTNIFLDFSFATQLIAGYAVPLKGTPILTLVNFGTNVQHQALGVLNDMKLAHYAKVPPRAVFRAQVFATLISSIVVLGTVNFQLTKIHGICTPEAINSMYCPGEQVVYNATVVWGIIGPHRIFDHIYPVIKYMMIAGILLPIPFYIYAKFIRKRPFRQFSPTYFMFGMVSNFAPYNITYITCGFYISFAFMCYVRNRYTSWFEKYTYIMGAGLDAGVSLSAILIYFSVQYFPKTLSWWGNIVSFSGQDMLGGSHLMLPERGYFGPDNGSFS